MHIKCPVCASDNVRCDAAYRAQHRYFKGMNRIHCCDCGLDYASPMPDDQLLDEFNNSYFHSAHGGSAKDTVAKAFFSGIARLRMNMVKQYLSDSQEKVNQVLEWGPGEGYFAKNWLNDFPDTHYYAVETDTSCHPSLQKNGVDILKPAKAAEISSDLVVMSHVLEHVKEPNEFIATTTKSLKKGGIAFIEVPCKDWRHKDIDEPHLLFFDKPSMKHLLSKQGFQVLQIEYYGAGVESSKKHNNIFYKKLMSLRSRLIAMGIVKPFASNQSGLECISDPVECAAVVPFKAHVKSEEPAWWLRVIAKKL